MVFTQKGWAERIAFSLFTKEVTYDAGVTMNDTNACEMTGFEADATWPDRVESDKTEVTGLEYGTTQEVINYAAQLTYNEAHAKANAVAGLGALVLGSVNSVQELALASYVHTITPAPIGTPLPSMQVEHSKGGVQWAYKGVKGQSIMLSGEEGGPLTMAVELIGSGTRAASATAFPSKLTENWLLLTNCKVWMEDGSQISISGSPAQGTQDISSATPVNLGPRIKSFSWKYSNNNQVQYGFGSSVAQDMDFVRRTVDLQLTLLFNDETEINHYVNQDALAIEFDLTQALVDPGGSNFYGLQLIIPRSQLKVVPRAEGGVDDALTLTLDCNVEDDGTNPVSKLIVYNAQPQYMG